ncbi:MAG: penicillin-binding protein [Enterococcaceae bacterium]|nr:penicillin-binding protein [Enterococcaceae bacterium]MCI1918945.1 penicillin-binding protein [Enterococcaceae bacterium]
MRKKTPKQSNNENHEALTSVENSALTRKNSINATRSHRRFSLSTIISICILFLLFFGALGGGIWAYQKYSQPVKQSIQAGYQKSAKITKDDFLRQKSTTVLDQNGQPLKEFVEQQQDYLPLAQIDKDTQHALIATEDKRFYEHHGVDTQALFVVLATYMTGNGTRGGSTLTQQLVKNIYLSNEVTVSRKIEEMVIAQNLEKKFSKQQILEFYLNNVYFGHGAYGINSASKLYYQKPVAEISLAQKASLIALTNNPSYYDPSQHLDRLTKRTHLVLKNMRDQKYLSEKTYQKALKEKLDPTHNPSAIDNSITDPTLLVAMDEATRWMMQDDGFQLRHAFTDEADEKAYETRFNELYEKTYQKILRGGYEIKTVIDPDLEQRLQALSDQAMAPFTEVDPTTGFYKKQVAITVIDNATGMVKASIGGRGEKGNLYNRALSALRQPGSAIKPFVSYAPAFAYGSLENRKVSDERADNNYPNNVYQGSRGMLTLREALTISSNVVPYRLITENAAKQDGNYMEPLQKMSFRGLMPQDNNPIIAVGGFTLGLTNQDMTAALATLTNQGNYRTPGNIQSITKKKTNKKVYERSDQDFINIYPADASYLTLDAMKTVLSSSEGTAHDIAGQLQYPYTAAKTGTTDQAKDLWMIGTNPYYSVAVWIGDDTPAEQDNNTIGAKTREIFAGVMNELTQGKEAVDFPQPKTVSDQGGLLVTRSSQEGALIKQETQAEKDRRTQSRQWLKEANEADAYWLKYGLTLAEEEQREQEAQEAIAKLAVFPLTVTEQNDNWTIFEDYFQRASALLQKVKRKEIRQTLHEQLIQAQTDKSTELVQLRKDAPKKPAIPKDTDSSSSSSTAENSSSSTSASAESTPSR